jgi:hypothetical protein
MLDDVDGLGFVEKSTRKLRILGELSVQDLHSGTVIDANVRGLIDRSHRTFPKPSHQPKVAKLLTD